MIRASELGKSKMVSQVMGISLVLLAIHWPAIESLAIYAMWAVVLFGLASAVDYFRKFWRQVDESVKQRRRSELLAIELQKRPLADARGSTTTTEPRP